MTIARGQRSRLIGALAIAIAMLMGCASVAQFFNDNLHSKKDGPADGSLANALAVYQTGDYDQALRLFKWISVTDDGDGRRQTAELGEICCRLMLANSPAKYTAAINMWEEYRKSASGDDDLKAELILLDPLFRRLSVLAEVRRIDTPPPATAPVKKEKEPEKPEKPAATTDQQLQTELAALKKKAAQASQLQHELDTVMEENRSLKEKIKALEAIDQTIQKKKTEISAPSE